MLNQKGERELAYVAKITDKQTIEGYDRICKYYVNGWSVVGGKDDFEINDLCIFIEPDALCPYTDMFKFLDEHIDEFTGRKTSDRHKIKIQKFCKGTVISGGLIIPVTEIKKQVKLGDFLTEELGITYWEKEDNQRKADYSKYTSMQARHKKFFKTKLGKWLMKRQWGRKICFFFLGKKKDKKTDWPAWVVKTDEERCLAGDTIILTDQGELTIKEIVENKIPCKVLSMDINSYETSYREILDYQKFPAEKELIELSFYDDFNPDKKYKVVCSGDHKFYYEYEAALGQAGYIEAQDIKDIIEDSNGVLTFVCYDKDESEEAENRLICKPRKIKTIKSHEDFIYDIEVEGNHNFFANNVLTHNCQNVFNKMQDLNTKWIATEKIDGTSTTFTMKQGKPKKREMLVCSRNVVYNTPEKEAKNFYADTDGNVYLEMSNRYNIQSVLNYILDEHPEYEYVTIQGETYGGSIQKRNYGPEHKLAIFNVIYKENGLAPVRLNPIEMKGYLEELNEKLLTESEVKLTPVPIVDENYTLPETCDDVLAMCGGESKIDKGMREGLVFRSIDGVNSFKAVDNEFIIKYHNS